MLINADYSIPVSVVPDQHRWTPSPQPGVERVMLDRVGGEKARATSLVRYAPGSHFPPHAHPGGEEILVLSGTFCADGERFPAGWYLRNPPGSSHQPSSADGALLFVKLWQMQPSETRCVRIDTLAASAWRHEDGRDVCPLFFDGVEQVSLQRLAPGAALSIGTAGGAELLVIDGELQLGMQRCARGSWVRVPVGDSVGAVAGEGGATVYLKTGHLAALTAGGPHA